MNEPLYNSYNKDHYTKFSRIDTKNPMGHMGHMYDSGFNIWLFLGMLNYWGLGIRYSIYNGCLGYDGDYTTQ